MLIYVIIGQRKLMKQRLKTIFSYVFLLTLLSQTFALTSFNSTSNEVQEFQSSALVSIVNEPLNSKNVSIKVINNDIGNGNCTLATAQSMVIQGSYLDNLETLNCKVSPERLIVISSPDRSLPKPTVLSSNPLWDKIAIAVESSYEAKNNSQTARDNLFTTSQQDYLLTGLPYQFYPVTIFKDNVSKTSYSNLKSTLSINSHSSRNLILRC